MSFKEGQKVEYAAHPVVAVAVDDAENKSMLELESSAGTEFMPHSADVEEDWRPATVLGVEISPGQPGVVDSTEVVHLDPDEGPPLHLNSKLVRAKKR